MFKVELEIEADIATVKMFGNAAELESGIMREVRKALDNNARNILIDMSGVYFIDSNAVQTIADTIRYAHKRDGKIFLTDIQPSTMRIITLNQKSGILPKFNTKREAIRELGFQRIEEYAPQKMRILALENFTSISKELSRLFKELRLWYTYKLKATPIGPEAHELVKEFQPSVILLDSTIGTEDGIKFIQWLKSDYLYWYIPILVVSTEGMIKKALHFIENGADDVIIYPFKHGELNSRLQFAIQMYNIVKRVKEREIEADEEQHI